MIFAAEGHIEMIRNGLATGYHSHVPQETSTFPVKLIPEEVVKTQTRRLNRGIYKVGKDYAVQKKRGVKAEPGIRIVMDEIYEEKRIPHGIPTPTRYFDYYIRAEDAWAEGGYMPEEYEKLFIALNPKKNQSRWVFKFHVIEV